MTLSFWIILLAALGYGALHSLLASLSAKALARRWFGTQADRWYRLAFNVIAVVTLLPILLLLLVLVDKPVYRIPFPWIILTLVIQLVAVLTVIAGLQQTGIASFAGLRQIFPSQNTPSPVLVTGGLYRYVRHPLYTASLIFIWLIPIMSWNLFALNIGLTIYLILGAIVEERKLLLEFGEAYADYRRRTPMLIPRFKPRPGK
jgi:protein-S-isoprenylcysteine O-methyltransferase Ste14